VDLLLAVRGERAYLASKKKVYCVDWRKYDADNPANALLWRTAEFSEIIGRPFVTADSVFLTDRSKLSRIENVGGRVAEYYPKAATASWDAKEEGPGNVLITADHVVIAGANSVYGFTDLTLARARLDKEVA